MAARGKGKEEGRVRDRMRCGKEASQAERGERGREERER